MKDYFSENEVVCKCCLKGDIDFKLRIMLNTAREISGIPYILNSAYRCEKHNKDVGGSPTSSHMGAKIGNLKGLAVDIKAINSNQRFKIVYGLIKSGFKRILIYETFIHVDIDESKTQEILVRM